MSPLAVIGGVYLVWLGVQAWRGKPGDPSAHDKGRPASAGHDPWFGFRTGLLTDVTNLKSIAFFMSLFAAAIPAGTPLWAKRVVLGIGVVMDLSWYGLVGLAFSSGPLQAGYRRLQRRIDRGFGVLLVAVGLKLALD